MFIYYSIPLYCLFQRIIISNVRYNHATFLNTTKIQFTDRVQLFLACNVPQLQTDSFSILISYFCRKITPNYWSTVFFESTIDILVLYACFSFLCITNYNNFNIQILISESLKSNIFL
ncbi:hypothetical protein pb186bvf_004409 [Paramecium bursaria]